VAHNTATRRSKRPASESTVLLSPSHMLDPIGEQILEDNCREVLKVVWDEAQVAAAISTVDAVIVRGPAMLSASLMDRAQNLRFISVSGAGYDCVDIAAATARGLPVMYLPGFSALPVAEYIIGGLINCSRRIGAADRACRASDFDWDRRSTDLNGTLIAGAKLGLVGLGNIGRNVGRLATALGMRVAAYDPAVSEWPDNIERVNDVDALLRDSDFVSLNVPLTQETRGMLTTARIRSMKRGACLVNAARGELMDEQAVADALKDGHLAFGMFDVFESEPEVWKSPLATAPNCIVTPHIAGVTQTTIRDTVHEIARGVITGLDGKFDATRVLNPTTLTAMTN
jgi:phosphoglycerate dehydrogenase-like enzyme